MVIREAPFEIEKVWHIQEIIESMPVILLWNFYFARLSQKKCLSKLKRYCHCVLQSFHGLLISCCTDCV